MYYTLGSCPKCAAVHSYPALCQVVVVVVP